MDTPKELIDAGAWFGRQQAFAVVAAKCSAAQALSLKQIRDSRLYESLGLNWEDCCREHIGISRATADNLIRQLDEFGEAYFRLCELARISPETYRQIASHVDGDSIEIDGRKLAFVPENAPKIRAALHALRAELRQARALCPPPPAGIVQLQTRLDALLADVSRRIQPLLTPGDRAALQGLSTYAISKWSRIARTLEAKPEVA